MMPKESALFVDIVRQFGASKASHVKVGVRELDDAAVIRITDGHDLVIASDFVRGTEFYLFQLKYLSHYDVGYYLAAANISDMAAMGCRPAGLLSVFRYSKAMTYENLLEVLSGFAAAAERYDCPVVGGDTGGYVADVFSATAFSIVPSGAFLCRSAARQGDVLCVSGPVGGGIGALTYFKELKGSQFTLEEHYEEQLLQFWKRPNARVDFGEFLLRNCPTAACMDMSDGLKASVLQLSSSSKLGFRLNASSVPIVEATREVASRARMNPLTLASSASVDFELLFTVPSTQVKSLHAKALEAGLAFFEIGTADIEFQNELIQDDGSLTEFDGTTWDHQTGNFVKDIIDRSKTGTK
jgi:thiamine-monophosphate kinase